MTDQVSEKSEKATVNIFQRINNVMAVVKTVVKDAEIKINAYSSYKGVSHDAVTRLIRTEFGKNGIVVIPSMKKTEVEAFEFIDKNGNQKRNYITRCWTSITFVNIDDKTDNFEVQGFGMAIDSGDKGPGKAMSISTKNIYLKTLMLESLENDEERNENESAPVAPTKKSGVISEAQGKRLFAITKGKNADPIQIKQWILDNTGVKSSKDLNYKDYNDLVTLIEAGDFS